MFVSIFVFEAGLLHHFLSSKHCATKKTHLADWKRTVLPIQSSDNGQQQNNITNKYVWENHYCWSCRLLQNIFRKYRLLGENQIATSSFRLTLNWKRDNPYHVSKYNLASFQNLQNIRKKIQMRFCLLKTTRAAILYNLSWIMLNGMTV